jgi:hypothetical protein
MPVKYSCLSIVRSLDWFCNILRLTHRQSYAAHLGYSTHRHVPNITAAPVFTTVSAEGVSLGANSREPYAPEEPDPRRALGMDVVSLRIAMTMIDPTNGTVAGRNGDFTARQIAVPHLTLCLIRKSAHMRFYSSWRARLDNAQCPAQTGEVARVMAKKNYHTKRCPFRPHAAKDWSIVLIGGRTSKAIVHAPHSVSDVPPQPASPFCASYRPSRACRRLMRWRVVCAHLLHHWRKGAWPCRFRAGTARQSSNLVVSVSIPPGFCPAASLCKARRRPGRRSGRWSRQPCTVPLRLIWSAVPSNARKKCRAC